MKTEDILKNLLLPNNKDWQIESVTYDDSTEEIYVKFVYIREDVVIKGKCHPIYDYREERNWRHLDLWQYKTFIDARIPRYWDKGRIVSIEVPWALPSSRLSWLMKKNDRHATCYQEPKQDSCIA